MLFTCVYVLLTSAEASNMHGNYTPHWAVQIRGGPDVANRLAAKHGFFNMGLVSASRITICHALLSLFLPTDSKPRKRLRFQACLRRW